MQITELPNSSNCQDTNVSWLSYMCPAGAFVYVVLILSN